MFLEIRNAIVSAKSLAAHGIEADKPEECAVPLPRYFEIILMILEFSLNKRELEFD